MPKLYVNDSGSWKQVKRMWVNDGGTWKDPNVSYVNSGGTQKQFYPDTIATANYTTPGSYTYTVPAGVTSLDITYPDVVAGMTTATVAVTPLSSYTVTIGNYTQNSSFGTLLYTATYSKLVASLSGNVDSYLYSSWGTATTTSKYFSGSGPQSTLGPAAAAAGCYYAESEAYHGDLSASIVIQTCISSSLINSFQVAITSFSGRGSYSITQQPTAGNSYVAVVGLFDNYPDEGSYSYQMELQQIVPLQIQPTNPYART